MQISMVVQFEETCPVKHNGCVIEPCKLFRNAVPELTKSTDHVILDNPLVGS